MHKLGFLDASFLYTETPSTPMNIASLQLLELPMATESTYFEDLKRFLAPRVHQVPFMRRKLKATPLLLDQPVWVDATDFDINAHMFRVVLPAPGTMRQLETTVARLHETPLDRTRPLWAFYLIEGLQAGISGKPNAKRVVALYCKYHHACIDGMAGQRILDVLYSDSLDALPPIVAPPASEPEPGFFDLVLDAIRAAADQSLASGQRVNDRMRAVNALVRRAMRGGAGFGAFAQTAPRTPFNTVVGPYRAYAAASLPLPVVRALAKSVHASINDVVMAVCAAGLRHYLTRRGALPDEPLLAGVPVSLREPGDASLRNRVTLLIASLATNVENPVERLTAIKRSVRLSKSVLVETRALQLEDFHMPGLPLIVSRAARTAEQLKIADYVGGAVNVVISNVMGPLRPKFLIGARMLTHYPVSIPAHSAALNLTVQTYTDRIDLGVTACLDAVPDADVLRDDIVAGWEELRDALGYRVEPHAQAA